MKLRDYAAVIGLDVGCSDNSCIWGSPGGMGTNGGCQCQRAERVELRMEMLRLARVARAALDENIKMAEAFAAISAAAGCEDLQPKEHGKAIAKYIDETVGKAARVYEDNRKLHAQIDRLNRRILDLEMDTHPVDAELYRAGILP